MSAPLPPRLIFEAMLARQGGLYTFEDVIAGIHSGKFQSWVEGDTWAITQVVEYPQKKAIEIVWVIGPWDAHDVLLLEDRIVEWGDELGINTFFSFGREGFINRTLPGWKPVARFFLKDTSHG